MKPLLLFALLVIFSRVALAQTPVKKPTDVAVGDLCDGCESMYAGIPDLEKINWSTSLASAGEPGERMEIKGVIYQPDGKSPAKDVVVYFYHTDAKGYYSPGPNQTEAKRHGHLRGWVRTNTKGEFQFTSIRPAAYPERNIPAHIHILVKEPGKTLYWIDEVWFDDDPLLTAAEKSKAPKRGGDMIVHLTKDGTTWRGSLSITLGKNVPNYK